jgi:Protein of unknown function (DUF2795)
VTHAGYRPPMPEGRPVSHRAPVTRTEVIEHVGGAFADGPATTSRLVAEARATDARPKLLALLRRLPERTIAGPHDLWVGDLADIPVER